LGFVLALGLVDCSESGRLGTSSNLFFRNSMRDVLHTKCFLQMSGMVVCVCGYSLAFSSDIHTKCFLPMSNYMVNQQLGRTRDAGEDVHMTRCDGSGLAFQRHITRAVAELFQKHFQSFTCTNAVSSRWPITYWWQYLTAVVALCQLLGGVPPGRIYKLPATDWIAHIRTGVAPAILPTSSSACIMRLMRAASGLLFCFRPILA
jgi:hypothetical protein